EELVDVRLRHRGVQAPELERILLEREQRDGQFRKPGDDGFEDRLLPRHVLVDDHEDRVPVIAAKGTEQIVEERGPRDMRRYDSGLGRRCHRRGFVAHETSHRTRIRAVPRAAGTWPAYAATRQTAPSSAKRPLPLCRTTSA